ncbi:MAG: 50S ribosomal protein L11 methyltransferase [Actinomycetota bacterium]|nr:50S ribosomal protein L11 methyltransferase [Actinomycetota bacterium]
MIRLSVRCAPEQAELVLAELLQIAPGGVEEEAGPGWVEYAIYGGEGELPELGGVEAAAGDGLVEIRSESVPDDWADRWRDFHEPTELAGGRVVIRPSWRDNPIPHALDIVIDPGRAFGTGAHPTTRMCVELLVVLADDGRAEGPAVDLGTGSAILAIVAAKLGFDPVSGVDLERPALEAAATNARENGVEIQLSRLNLRDEAPPSAPTMIANLTAPLLTGIAARLAVPEPPRRIVCSGLLTREAGEVTEAFAGAGFVVREQRASADWSALLLTPG